jgi:photosystem II stability/assembly factor-like uncharacterized protein
MSERFLVGTRKGLFAWERRSGSWELIQRSFVGSNVSMALADSRDGALYCALNHGHFGVKLHRSTDGGNTWPEIACPAYPAAPEPAPAAASGGAEKAPSLKEIWSLEAGGPDEPGLLWAGTIPGGLFVSRDRGDSWSLVDSLWTRAERKEWFGGGKDEPGIHSVAVDPRDPRCVRLGISCGGVWTTRDGGQSWNCTAQGMRAAYMPPEQQFNPNIQDAHRMVQCPAAPEVFWVQHHNGIFRTTDGAASWQEIDRAGPSTFGFAVAVHPQDADTAWFVPAEKDELRLPVESRVVVTRTRDGGRTFDVLSEGLPQHNAFDIVYRHALDVDETGQRLAMGSSTGSLWLSENGGDSWTELSSHLPPIYCVRFGG